MLIELFKILERGDVVDHQMRGPLDALQEQGGAGGQG